MREAAELLSHSGGVARLTLEVRLHASCAGAGRADHHSTAHKNASLSCAAQEFVEVTRAERDGAGGAGGPWGGRRQFDRGSTDTPVPLWRE